MSTPRSTEEIHEVFQARKIYVGFFSFGINQRGYSKCELYSAARVCVGGVCD